MRSQPDRRAVARRTSCPAPARRNQAPKQGALVISLDLEAHWGVRHRVRPGDPYFRNLSAEREAVQGILRLFREYRIHATWATVGMLLARHRRELDEHRPKVLPRYRDPRLSPYEEEVGEDESDDPFHYAPTVVRDIAGLTGQEIGTHTFSHYFCREPGQRAEAFESDLDSALAIAARRGHRPRSIVFPRNQVNPAYLPRLARFGLRAYRGLQRPWMYQETRLRPAWSAARVARYADSHLPLAGAHTFRWDDIPDAGGLCNIPASFFLRARGRTAGARTRLHLRRLRAALDRAASTQELVHLWWHPHNFGAAVDANLAMLRGILEHFEGLRSREGMASLSMGEVTDVVEVVRG